MKYWLPAALCLMAAASAQAEDYHVVSSPSLQLDVFIDDVASRSPQAWCRETLTLRIVSAKATESAVLDSFLPQVGTLLQNQCGTLSDLSWQMTSSRGSVLAVGSAHKAQSWQPVITADATATATAQNAAPLDISRPASTVPLHTFTLPGGCRFRTDGETPGPSLFIPDAAAMSCPHDGWLEGQSEMTLADRPLPVAVTFYQGYPLRDLAPRPGQLAIVTANNQRLVVSRPDAADSWLVLPFIAGQHLWAFEGTLLVKMDKTDASNAADIKQRVAALRQTWSAIVDPQVKITVLLVDTLHAELADPAMGAWRTVN